MPGILLIFKESRLAAGSLLFLASLVLYTWGAAPGLLYGDSGELQAVAITGGIAHQTGYPLFSMTGWLFGKILPGSSAHRVTVMSSFFGAASVCMLFVVLGCLGLPHWTACMGAITYAHGFTFWWSSIRTEVYTLSIFTFLTSLLLTMSAVRNHSFKISVLAAFSLGITMTGHMAFAPAVAVMGLILASCRPKDRVHLIPYWGSLLLCFVAGLTPYLYLVWVDKGDNPVNYLKYSIEVGANQWGLTEETFDDPWERIGWLFFGRQARLPFVLLDARGYARLYARNMAHVLKFDYIYHFGLAAIPLSFMGYKHIVTRWRERINLLLILIVFASHAFVLTYSTYRMRPIFMMPITITTVVMVSIGITRLHERLRNTGTYGQATITFYMILLGIFLIALPHALRNYAKHADFIPKGWKMHTEYGPDMKSFFPSLRGYREPQWHGEKLIELIPENALVIGWGKEMTVTFYMHHAEKQRPDITLAPIYHHAHLVRLKRWQESHDMARNPFVFISPIKGVTDKLPEPDTLRVDTDNVIYVCRRPIDLTPMPQSPPSKKAQE